MNQNGVDLVLLAGDLFDSDTTYRETLEALSEALGAMRARVFIAPGNHDPYSAKSPYATLSWPENVHVFTSKTVERVELPELQCAVYGAAFTAPVQDESLLAGFRAPEDDFIHLMVLHGDISATESRYDPLTKEQIKESGIDYLALGHTHQFGGFLREGQTTYAYSGCPEGRGFDELGEKGVYMGEISKGENRLEFLPTARRMCLYEKIDVTGSETNAAAAEKILAVLKEKYGENYAENLFKIELTGTADVNTAEIQGRLGALYFVKLRDKTESPVNYDELSREISLKGLFVKNMLSRLNAAEKEEKENLKEALKLGLKAFDGEVSCDEN